MKVFGTEVALFHYGCVCCFHIASLDLRSYMWFVFCFFYVSFSLIRTMPRKINYGVDYEEDYDDYEYYDYDEDYEVEDNGK